MGKVRIVKKYDEREVVSRSGRIYYVVRAAVNFLVDESEEYVVDLYFDRPGVAPGEYEVSLNDIRLRVRETRSFMPGFPVPGIPNTIKKP